MSRIAGAAFSILLTAPAVAAPHLLRNGGFEHGDFTGWTLSGNTEYSQVFNQPYDGLAARHGADYALLGPQGADGVLSQSFADAAGAKLTISFWLASDGGTADDFTASYDGDALMRVADAGAFGWTRYAATVSATGLDTLSFSFRDDQDYFALDTIRVRYADAATTRGQPIPEPPAGLPVAAALALLACRRRRPRA